MTMNMGNSTKMKNNMPSSNESTSRILNLTGLSAASQLVSPGTGESSCAGA